MGITYADRTRVLTGQLCLRKRYLETEFPTDGIVPGIQPAHLNADLLVGICYHVGIQWLLSGNSVDEAVEAALTGDQERPGYWPLVKSKGLMLGDRENASYVYYEQASLVEALIRGYNYFALPQLLARFIIVEIEAEDKTLYTLPDGSFQMLWGSRVDALLMERETMDLYALSEKTTKEYNSRSANASLHDMQGLSEVSALDSRLAGWQKTWKEGGDVPAWFHKRADEGYAPKMLGVKMEYALKGMKIETPKGSGQWFYSNALIRPWKKTDDLEPKRRGRGSSFGFPYAVSYDFTDDMGGNHRLGKGWNRINIWEDMGVKEWIDCVNSEEIQGFRPGYAIENQFILPEDIVRNEEDMLRWERRTLHGERRIQIGREAVKAAFGTPNFEDKLDEHFPPSSNACDYPTRCPYQEICFSNNKSFLYDPIGTGLFSIREANHKIEEEIREGE